MWDIPETILTERSEERVLEYVLDMLADPAEFREKSNTSTTTPKQRVATRFTSRMGDGSIGIPPRSSARMAPTMDGSGCIAISPSAKERERQLSTLMDNIPGWSTAVATSQGGPWSSSAKAVRS